MFTIYATDYAPVDPITPPCDIVPIFIGYRGENKARCLVFDLTECVNTFGDGGFVISFIRQGDELPYLVTDTDRLDNNAIWIITDTDTAVDGYGMVQLQYIVDDVVCKSALYRTVTFDSNGIPGDVPDPYEDLLAQIAAYAAQAEGAATTATAAAQTATTAVEEGVKTERSQRIAADEGLNTRINELIGLAGAPSMANSAAAMTDSSKVYVYTGSEAGYLTGHWYYYNGTEWADGGVYQATAINTDKTLTVENMAADAAVAGERIDECMAAFVVNSASGDIASFADGADGVPLKDLVVNIQPKQASGTPSPTNILPITGWTAANITRAGKNLLHLSLSDIIAYNGAETFSGNVCTKGGGTCTMVTDSNGNVTECILNGTFSARADFSLIRNKDLSNFSNKLLSGVPSGGGSSSYSMFLAMQASPYTSYGVDTGNGATLGTIQSTNTMLFIRVAAGYTANNVVIKPMIRPASFTDATFEPYNGNTYNISFGSSAGTVYGGTLDVTTGMLTVTWALANVPKTGQIITLQDAVCYRYELADLKILANYDAYMCTHFSKTDPIWNNPSNGNVSNQRSNYYNVVLRNDSLTTFSDWTNWLDAQETNGTPVQLCYALAQPISYQLTPAEVKTLLGNNNIWSDTGSVASCEYRADTKLYIEHLTDPDGDMIADSNITSGSYFMVNNSLYLATANIANGGAITPGTNCTATNLAAALNAINS